MADISGVVRVMSTGYSRSRCDWYGYCFERFKSEPEIDGDGRPVGSLPSNVHGISSSMV